MDWYDNNLILLPQYTDRFKSEFKNSIFYIPKSEITDYLKNNQNVPLKPGEIELNSHNIEMYIEGFQGYEAIIFNGENVYLAIEAEIQEKMFAYIVRGTIDLKLRQINLLPESLKKIPLPADLKNMAIETLLFDTNRIIAIYEANGKNVNKNPTAIVLDTLLQDYDFVKFPEIEYRITDATDINENYFWVTNYFFPGESKILKPALDIYSKKSSSEPEIHAIERLVQFHINNNEIKISNKSPLNIRINDNEKSRNWEGIVKYDSLGFLIITDRFPRTILAYIPYSLGTNDLTVFENKKRFGYKNSLNFPVIEPQYIYAQEFISHGIAAVVDDSGWVYINKSGKKLIRPHVVDNAPDYFSFGLARFKQDDKFGFFNEQGEIIINPQFDYARAFSDSMAAVCSGCRLVRQGEHIKVEGGKWGFINIYGEIAVPIQFDKVTDFKSGFAEIYSNGISQKIKKK